MRSTSPDWMTLALQCGIQQPGSGLPAAFSRASSTRLSATCTRNGPLAFGTTLLWLQGHGVNQEMTPAEDGHVRVSPPAFVYDTHGYFGRI
mmetsp:Transcript_15725/g.35267  ORF Transcript_15725/g.35267 Transcript_15725/m.35267 type:complete len:91 (+) Transcript_15725:195-467(+)